MLRDTQCQNAGIASGDGATGQRPGLWPGTDRSAMTPSGVRVHPHALCESSQVGRGTRVWAFAHILPGAVVGTDCNVCDGAYIEYGAVVGDRVTVKNQVMIFEGVTVEDDVFLGPGVTFTNDLRPRAPIKRAAEGLLPTLVRRGATLGAGVVVVCGTTIGEHAFVAAGTVVVADVPAHAIVLGNPGRQRGWACRCGARLPATLICGCRRSYRIGPGGLIAAVGASADDNIVRCH